MKGLRLAVVGAVTWSTALAATAAAQQVAEVQPTAASPVSGGSHAREVLSAMAEQAKSKRVGGTVALLSTGGAMTVAGLVADLEYDQSYGEVLWIAGAVTVGLGGINLFVRTPIEQLHGKYASGGGDEHLRAEWAALAEDARSSRTVQGFISLGIGAVGLGAAGAVAAGVGDLDDPERQDWTVALIIAGGATVGGGLAALLVQTDLEAGYNAAYGSTTEQYAHLNVGVGPAPGGGYVALNGNF